MNIPLFKIYWDEDDIEKVNSVIRSGKYWCTGKEIQGFEEKINEYLKTKYCKTFNSGGSALYALMSAYGFKPGDEIIVPSFTFIATAYAPLYVGAKPVFGDVERKSFGLDPEDVNEKITSRTVAVMPIHYAGIPCQIKALKDICEDNGLKLIEDAAEAFGAKYDGKFVGTYGDASIFSFCQNKIFSTSEGGCVVTEDKSINGRLDLFRSYGRVTDGDYFDSSDGVDYVSLGHNFRISSILANLGISQIEKVDTLTEMRRKNASYMNERLKDIDGIVVPSEPDEKTYSVYQMYTITIEDGKKTRDDLMVHLHDNGISNRICFDPVHEYSIFRDLGYGEISLPVTKHLSERVITLPMYPHLKKEEMDHIVDKIKEYFGG